MPMARAKTQDKNMQASNLKVLITVPGFYDRVIASIEAFSNAQTKLYSTAWPKS